MFDAKDIRVVELRTVPTADNTFVHTVVLGGNGVVGRPSRTLVTTTERLTGKDVLPVVLKFIEDKNAK